MVQQRPRVQDSKPQACCATVEPPYLTRDVVFHTEVPPPSMSRSCAWFKPGTSALAARYVNHIAIVSLTYSPQNPSLSHHIITYSPSPHNTESPPHHLLFSTPPLPPYPHLTRTFPFYNLWPFTLHRVWRKSMVLLLVTKVLVLVKESRIVREISTFNSVSL